jgi:hypothetical protein
MVLRCLGVRDELLGQRQVNPREESDMKPLLITVLAFALTACSPGGGGATEQSTATASATATPTEEVTPTEEPSPTEEPTPEPTATPEPTPEPALSFAQQKKAAKKVSYDNLFRHSDDYLFESIVYTGQIIQVLGDPGSFQFRINVTKGDYGLWDDTVLVDYSGTERFLEDDIVEFVGLSAGPITYQSVFGGDITIPGFSVDEKGMRLVKAG